MSLTICTDPLFNKNFDHKITEIILESVGISFEVKNKVSGVALFILEGISSQFITSQFRTILKNNEYAYIQPDDNCEVVSKEECVRLLQIESNFCSANVPKSNPISIYNINDSLQYPEKIPGLSRRILLDPIKNRIPIPFSIEYSIIQPKSQTICGVSALSKWTISSFHYILSGNAIAMIEDKRIPLNEGASLVVPANSKWQFTNSGNTPLSYLTILNKGWKPEYNAKI